MTHRQIEVNDMMLQGYVHQLVEPLGRQFHPDFRPRLIPKQMLELGVFGGKYMTDCAAEYLAEWFENAKLCSRLRDPHLNYFGVNASQPLSIWRTKGGSTTKIREAGSSGTAATFLADAVPTTNARSAAGAPFSGT